MFVLHMMHILTEFIYIVAVHLVFIINKYNCQLKFIPYGVRIITRHNIETQKIIIMWIWILDFLNKHKFTWYKRHKWIFFAYKTERRDESVTETEKGNSEIYVQTKMLHRALIRQLSRLLSLLLVSAHLVSRYLGSTYRLAAQTTRQNHRKKSNVRKQIWGYKHC